METKFNFNSQICTTREQSEHLLALGLKKETADIRGVEGIEHTPTYAWSLHRLIEMMPTLIYRRERQYWLDINNDGVCYNTNGGFACVEYIADNLYDNILYCIEWLIKEGFFNKKYLNGTTED